ncbi:MAG: glycosyltransferase family 2 protein [Nitrospirota bacterium]|nr:MAG: glycosyltransferase family 2 protein [Nitrospirota bacterium]
MRVSVIIPVFNGELYIEKAVSSVLSQSYHNCEIIIIDDASTDKTRSVIKGRFGDLIGNKIKYHLNDMNRERAYSRNRGAEMAEGKYLFFLDYDDEWEKDYVQSTIDIFEENGCDIVYSLQRTFIDELSNIKRVSSKGFPGDTGKNIFSSAVGYPTATAFRKSVFSGYIDKYIPREDWEIFIRSYIEGRKICIADNNKVMVRAHGSRTSAKAFFWSSTLKVYNDYIDKVPEGYRGEITFHAGEVCFRFGDIFNGWKLIIKALFLKPDIMMSVRKILSVIKRGFRIDKFFRFYGDRADLKQNI